jgi:hypothetical protein
MRKAAFAIFSSKGRSSKKDVQESPQKHFPEKWGHQQTIQPENLKIEMMSQTNPDVAENPDVEERGYEPTSQDSWNPRRRNDERPAEVQRSEDDLINGAPRHDDTRAHMEQQNRKRSRVLSIVMTVS